MIANIGLSFEVECSPGFAGESCVPDCSTDPCSNNGTCLQSVSGFFPFLQPSKVGLLFVLPW